MKIYETYDVFEHKVNVKMENTPDATNEFKCYVGVDNRPAYVIYSSFAAGETLTAEKPFISIIEDALDYEKNNNLGDFIKNLGYSKSSQEINAGHIMFMASQEANTWLKSHFSMEEVKNLFCAIDEEYEKENMPEQNMEEDTEEESLDYEDR